MAILVLDLTSVVQLFIQSPEKLDNALYYLPDDPSYMRGFVWLEQQVAARMKKRGHQEELADQLIELIRQATDTGRLAFRSTARSVDLPHLARFLSQNHYRPHRALAFNLEF